MKCACEIYLEIDRLVHGYISNGFSIFFHAIGHWAVWVTLTVNWRQWKCVEIFAEANTSWHSFTSCSEREIEYLWNTNFDFLLESEVRWLVYETARRAISNMSQQVSSKLLLWLQSEFVWVLAVKCRVRPQTHRDCFKSFLSFSLVGYHVMLALSALKYQFVSQVCARPFALVTVWNSGAGFRKSFAQLFCCGKRDHLKLLIV